jgi:monofunctional glycosyltransferase
MPTASMFSSTDTIASVRSTPARLGIVIRGLLAWAALIFLGLQLWFFLHIVWWKYTPPPSTAFMRQRTSENPDLAIQYRWVPYTQLSPHLKRALIASEDANFLSHQGFDWEGIRLAYLKNQRRGHIVAGGSSISQQLAKNLFLSDQKSMLRKAQEALITLMIECVWNKTRILEVYSNVIEWGNGLFGAEAAAQHYFSISASHLSTKQAAQLAAMVPSPRYYEKHLESHYLQRRTAIIRARLMDVAAPR